jgi:trk system potassium uptake protein TrkH
VSAFCNAGFALQGDSMEMFREQPIALLLVALLIVLGGTGFVVLAAVVDRLAGPRRPLAVQSRVVVSATVVLLLAGTLVYALAEWDRSLAGLGAVDKLVNAFFQSATLRTAGFNSVGLSVLAPATTFFMMTFMFLGGSPGSTAGGIKTTTAAVLLAAVRSAMRGLRSVNLFRRAVPADVVVRSVVIVAVSALVLAGGFFALLVVEDQPFVELLFEAVSAFGTVGLSLGATAALSPAGKLVVAALMLAGRLGPLTLALLLGSKRGPDRHGYPEARIMVG